MRRLWLVVLLVGCGKEAAAPRDASVSAASESDAAPAPAAPINRTFADRALAIAAEYPSWGRVDDELRWAPGLCRLPRPGLAYMSESDDAATHGQKLYSVFAKRHAEYPKGPHADQVVVKESWTAVPSPGVRYDPEANLRFDGGDDHFYPYARKGDAVYRAGERAGLYIMFRLDPATPDTDAGWVYATVSAGGAVTAAGRVSSCMHCHEDADHERLFGVPKVSF